MNKEKTLWIGEWYNGGTEDVQWETFVEDKDVLWDKARETFIKFIAEEYEIPKEDFKDIYPIEKVWNYEIKLKKYEN